MVNKSESNISFGVANEGDVDWINQQYNKVGFKQSNFANETIVIATVGQNKAGLGRLQNISQGTAELGGMYVDESYRGFGLASNIVKCLLENATEYSVIYCLPFEHLATFYQSFGFKPVEDTTKVPKVVMDKHTWCNETYQSNTLLFVLNK